MDIEAALSWAFLEELPKREVRPARPASGRRPQTLARSSVRADTLVQAMMEMPVNRFGVVRDLGSFGEPHPDAVAIGEAVNGLGALAIEFPPDWRPLPELHGLHPEVTRLVDEATVAARTRVGRGGTFLGTSLPALVRRHALARTTPDWRVPIPELRYRTHPNGQPMWFVRRLRWEKSADGRDVQAEVEEDGFNARGRRPYGDAYRKPYLRPAPDDLIMARGAYELWHAALATLAAELAPCLASLTLQPFTRSAAPWTEPEIEAPSTAPCIEDLADLIDLATPAAASTHKTRSS